MSMEVLNRNVKNLNYMADRKRSWIGFELSIAIIYKTWWRILFEKVEHHCVHEFYCELSFDYSHSFLLKNFFLLPCFGPLSFLLTSICKYELILLFLKNILTFESCSFSFCNYLNIDRFVKINLSWCLCYKT